MGENQQTSKNQDFLLQRNFETDERTALTIFNDPFSTPYSPVLGPPFWAAHPQGLD
jgi:hypothetical protein